MTWIWYSFNFKRLTVRRIRPGKFLFVPFLLNIFITNALVWQSGATLAAVANDVKFEHLTVVDGLPHNSITNIVQDRHGFLWITTQNGLVKYDGYRFENYAPEPGNSNSINAINVTNLEIGNV